MKLSYRGVKLNVGQAKIEINSTPMMNGLQELYAHEQRWELEIYVYVANGLTGNAALNDVKSKTAVIENLFSVNNGDLLLYYNDGVNLSHHQLFDATCLGGVRIIEPPTYPIGTGVEAANFRTIRCTVGGIKPKAVADLRSALYMFEETLEQRIVSPQFGHIEVLNMPAVPQHLRTHALYRYLQKGSALGLYKRPTVPQPIFPSQRLHNNVPLTSKGHPERIGDSYQKWPLSWQWEFESNVPLVGDAHVWGLTI